MSTGSKKNKKGKKDKICKSKEIENDILYIYEDDLVDYLKIKDKSTDKSTVQKKISPLLEKKEKGWKSKPKDCIVCYESLKKESSSLSCGHWIHKKCIIKWGKGICPI